MGINQSEIFPTPAKRIGRSRTASFASRAVNRSGSANLLDPFSRGLGLVFHRNARFPLGPSALAFTLNSRGSNLDTTGLALRDLAGR